ncbi:site-specific integrase [Streptomyces phaeochromogenes]|uniref:Site-specific integrase n=1 Tax=Streptomyces phaeochromogenes TaxID=1923 RepID=A0ABZ1HEC0_STRPH|nr:site-specific integrase [Streptomyces phaeochromogenes]WSD16933.1 site-specific integrase [Streptomyces phaeochromogenes]
MTTRVLPELLVPPTQRSLAGVEAAALLQRFPARPRATTWPTTALSREEILERTQEMRRPPGAADVSQGTRMVGVRLMLSWLQTFPGVTWQDRWLASPAASDPERWHKQVCEWAKTVGRSPDPGTLRTGFLALMCVDAIRPDLHWLASNPSRYVRPAIQAARDPEGFARLEAAGPPTGHSSRYSSEAFLAIAQIIVAYGGKVEEITVGDCLARLQASRGDTRSSRSAYVWLRDLGQFPPDAPATLVHFAVRSGQASPAELVDRYGLRCTPVRDLIVDYLTERQPSLDYNSLKTLSASLASLFWADLERHHPGIDSLALSADASTAWKARLATKSVRKRQPDGTFAEVTEPRDSAPTVKQSVRAFYLDIAQWALDEPERWGPWAAPAPVSEADCSVKKNEQRQKSRSDQRTRERLPVLPVLVRVADRRLKEARARLDALNAAELGSTFTVLGETFTVPRSTNRADGRPSSVRDTQGRRRELGAEEKRAFWAWATIEILRHTGIRIEELRELGHHSVISYTLPTTGEVVPLLQIAPSKTDQERLLLITPELADVLSAVISRVRRGNRTVPVIHSYDHHEKTWKSPMPLLYQWHVSGEDRQISEHTIRDSLNDTLAASGLTDTSGKPLNFEPHDFRRIFITDAILNGLPPHIAQVIAGHSNINTTMGYAAIYPADAIEAHQAFIARRRALRPIEEYRAVTPEEWQEFLGHFERRKLALGECGRAYGTDCAHEHACVRCPVLIVDFTDRPRLVEIRENLTDRIEEAEREGWLGEVEGLSVSQTAAEEKIAQLDARKDRKESPVFMGIPSFEQIVARASEVQAP